MFDVVMVKSYVLMMFFVYCYLFEFELMMWYVDENDMCEVYFFVIGVFDGDSFVGMSVGEILFDFEFYCGLEFLLVFVNEFYRRCGVGICFVVLVECIVCNNGFGFICVIYMMGKLVIGWVECILVSCGWFEFEGCMIMVCFMLELFKLVLWFEKFSKLCIYYEIFDWKDFKLEECEWL